MELARENNLIGFFETSSKTGHNVAAAFEKLAEELVKDSELRILTHTQTIAGARGTGSTWGS